MYASQESLELKRDYVQKCAADVLVMGDDWAGKFDDLADICQVVDLTRIPFVDLHDRGDREDRPDG